MSTKNAILALGIAAPALFWVTPDRVAAQDRPEAPAPIAPPTSAKPAGYSVLLLNNGRLLQGRITEDPDTGEYVLQQAGGTIRFPKHDAERAFSSLEEVYRYKASLVPEGDADETYKLARWCLEHRLDVHARENLAKVAELSPGFLPAKRMIASIDANASVRRETPTADPDVALAGAEIPARSPSALDPRVVKARRDMMRSGGVPVIFDLPTPEAVKRATEFSRSVHLLVQRHCASCHNERYSGEFQLIETKTRRDLTPDVLRANLDAVLTIIDRDAPERSELLTAALLPHGPDRRQILKSPRDPAFQALSRWATSLAAAPANSADSAIAGASASREAEPTFGRDRAGAAASRPVAPVSGIPQLTPVPDAAALLYSGGGMLTPHQIEKMASVPGAQVRSETYKEDKVAPGVPPEVRFPDPSLPAPRPIAPNPPPEASPSPEAAASKTTKSKPKPLDPALLEKVLRKRREAGGS
ncbi:MAG: hypothetical protein SFX72_13900 [Isosphaeraceae bacterium]|nr:hypothetical protein [Isosphaeraceae bacterium]